MVAVLTVTTFRGQWTLQELTELEWLAKLGLGSTNTSKGSATEINRLRMNSWKEAKS